MIKITNREDYDFPKPAFGFGQTVSDSSNDIGFVVGMRFTSHEWEYQLFYTELEVLGSWVEQNQLAVETLQHV